MYIVRNFIQWMSVDIRSDNNLLVDYAPREWSALFLPEVQFVATWGFYKARRVKIMHSRGV
jgi:hypothetical protein